MKRRIIKTMFEKVREYACDERGVAAIEYGLLAAATGLTLASSFGGTIFRKPFYDLFAKIGSNL